MLQHFASQYYPDQTFFVQLCKSLLQAGVSNILLKYLLLVYI